MIWPRLIVLTLGMLAGCLPTRNCCCQEKTEENSKAVFLQYLFLEPAGQFVIKSFDIGDVYAGEDVPILIRLMNRSHTTFTLSIANSSSDRAKLLNEPVRILEGENGLVEMVIKIPENAKRLKDNVIVNANLGNGVNSQFSFSFRYRDICVFSKEFYTFTLDGADGPIGRHLSVQLPVENSGSKGMNAYTVDADLSLEGLTFSIVEKNGADFVEAQMPMDLIDKTRIAGKVRLKVDGKVVSEATLIVKKRTDIELLPNYVTLKYDPEKKEFCGELIAKLVPATVPIEHVQIEAEYGDETPIELSVGKMSKSTGRIYLRVKGDAALKNEDLILFRISTPLKTEEQVLYVTIVR